MQWADPILKLRLHGQNMVFFPAEIVDKWPKFGTFGPSSLK